MSDQAVERRVYSMWELQNIAYLESETIIGLASIFYLKCICDNINAIYSGQYYIKCGENRERKIF